jgi:uridine phosphorylase
MDNNELMYHIRIKKGDIGRYVLLPGDPFRTDYIASFLDNAKLVAHNREHKTWTGSLLGVPVSVTSTGMGGPSAAIAIEELIHCGADTFIRIGTAGRLCPESQDKAIQGIIATGAVRSEGLTGEYVPYEYPAIADRHVVAALADSAGEFGYNFKEGIVHCKDSFYGQIDPDGLPGGDMLKSKWKAWERSRVMATEMETATLLVISSIRGCRAGSILSFQSMEETVNVVRSALIKLIEKDRR